MVVFVKSLSVIDGGHGFGRAESASLSPFGVQDQT